MAMPRNAGAMNRVAVNVLGAGLVLALAGCGGGGSSSAKGTGGSPLPGGTGGISGGGSGGAGGTVVAGGTPAAMCKQFSNVLCTREGQCSGTPLSAADQSSCEGGWNTQFNCDGATTNSFSTCLQDTQALSCASLFQGSTVTFPVACENEIGNIPYSDAQTKCSSLVAALCLRTLQCAGGTPAQSDIDNCVQTVTSDPTNGIPCLLAISVGATYTQCLASLPTMACPNPDGGTAGGADGGASDAGAMATMPSACSGVIGYYQ